MFPTIERIEDFVESVEDMVYAQFSAVAPELPDFRETINRLWDDVSRFGPGLSDIHVPSLGDFQVPPPPPPPPPKSFVEKSAIWCSEHPWGVAGIGVGFVGAGLVLGYVRREAKKTARNKRAKAAGNGERRQVVVVLGGDKPLALPLILDLEKKGYIVVASVSTSHAVDELESKTHGYVRGLVLDPVDIATVPIFLRSLSSTLSRRFPINTGGDPHASPSLQPYIHSIISLLTLYSSESLLPAPLEHLSLEADYLPYLQSTHITPLQVIQALLPLLRNSHARAKDAVSNNKGYQSIVVCLPAIDTRVGLPFASAQAMSASATLQGIQVLRREINISGLSASDSDSMRNLRVVTVDVGAVDDFDGLVGPSGVDAQKAMDGWTPSEKIAYGSSFQSIVEQGGRFGGSSRTPSKVSVFVDSIVEIVGGERVTRGAGRFLFGVGLFYRFRTWVRGDRVSVGAGAGTYFMASNLPSFILETLINLPHFLISLRNSLLPVPIPRYTPLNKSPANALTTTPTHPPQNVNQRSTPLAAAAAAAQSESPPASEPEDHADRSSETGSEADVESNAGDVAGVGESWVSLKDGPGSSSGSDSPVRV